MSRLIFDTPAWWQRTSWRIAAAALAVTVLATWWAASSTVDHTPVVTRAADAPLAAMLRQPAVAEMVAPAAGPAAASAVAASPQTASPPLSTQVAPGIHVTPLSVPPGTVAVPAGPRADDSEPEN